MLADRHGSVVSLGERDCSVQRRHQKLIEETPSPVVDAALRRTFADAAVQLARAVGYVGAGTVEFLLDAAGTISFLEMNTRIQVEHTVTEMVTGIDLVREQILVAGGAPLSFGETTVTPRGHAIECRINAEDPGRDFAPGPGSLATYREPSGPGIRVDGSLSVGGTINPRYDSMIAKLVVWDRDRPSAIARMERALAEFSVAGVPTTIPFHQAVLAHPVFRAGDATTTFLTDYPDILKGLHPANVAGAETGDDDGSESRTVNVEVGGRRMTVRIDGLPLAAVPAIPNRPGASGRSRAQRGGTTGGARSTSGPDLLSPIQGTVLRVPIAVGQPVSAGDVLVVIEAMKMENEIVAHRSGALAAVNVAVGDAVKIGTTLVRIADGSGHPEP